MINVCEVRVRLKVTFTWYSYFLQKFKKGMTSFSLLMTHPMYIKLSEVGIKQYSRFSLFTDTPIKTFFFKCMTGAFNQIAARSRKI